MRETMYYNSAKLLAVVLLLLVQWHSITVRGAERGCWEEERLALLQINATLTVPIHSAEGEWKGTDCCRWEKVTCDHTTGHVTELDLSSIQPDIHDYEYYYADDELFLNATMFLSLRQLKYLSLSGHGIPGFMAGAGVETWSNLTKLEVLDLSYNQLNGSIILPLARISSLRKLILAYNSRGHNSARTEGVETWSNLTKLEVLDLSGNNLNGSIIFPLARISSLRELILSNNYLGSGAPMEGIIFLSNLTKLEMLDLGNNFIPIADISSFAAIKSLRALYLDYNDIAGNISLKDFSALNLEVVSLRGCGYSGSLPYLGDWSSLKALALAQNDLNGTLKSKGLCRLKNLEELDLSYNSFTGNLPPCIGNISSLQILDLAYNQFKVKFPSITFERLIALRYLSLSYNHLEGYLSMKSFLNHSNLEVLGLSTGALNFRVKVVHLPFQLKDLELANCKIEVDPTFLCSQHELRVLDLSNTQSKGPIPVGCLLENNTNLIQLDLHKNFFTGPLQLPFLIHEKLELLDVSDNHLDGELPIDIANKLPNLSSLKLSINYFHGPLPSMAMSNIFILDVSVNNFSDDINNIFSKTFPFLSDILDLSYNNFYGYFPNNINLTGGCMLMLNDNSISGKLPFSICNVSFGVLDISNNKLNGVLPGCIGGPFPSLKFSGNHLEGPLPSELCAIQDCVLLDLSENKFSGSLPSYSNNSIPNILKLSHNNLTGNLPKTWLNYSDITSIDVQDNHLSGELPIYVGNESNLRILQASENLFEGHIPGQICQFKYLRILDLSQNNLSGQIPQCIIRMGTINNGYFSLTAGDGISIGKPDFRDTNVLLKIEYGINIDAQGKVNSGLELMSKRRSDLYWKAILQFEGAIDLSSNNLFGNIPKEIGQISWLITLNLSNNYFTGAIPNSISNLSQLQSLDLSHNSLTGEIPRDMSNLTSLESFSVAYNNLSGPTVDMKAQFGTFDNSSYEGNPNLCGPPLSKSCFPTLGTAEPPPIEMNKDKGHESTDFLIMFGSFALFFVISFWGFMVVLYFKRNWRYALFTLVDQYSDMIYVRVVLLVRKIGAARTERDN